jgi:Protein of unknown function (DUF1570)
MRAAADTSSVRSLRNTLIRSPFFRTLLGLAAALAGQPALAAAPSLLEVTEGGKQFEGKLEAKSRDACWLMGRDGQLAAFEISRVESVRTISPHFHEYSAAELRDQLRRELPKSFHIEGSGHFLVCAQQHNRRIGEICEDTYRTFRRYFSVRGFKISEPEFPLVVIVFPDREAFVNYCRKDKIEPPAGLLGYYMRLTNRIALFDQGDSALTTVTPSRAPMPASFAEIFDRRESPASRSARALANGPLASRPVRFDGIVEGDLHSTIVHETTHQVAFNTGLHSRIGQTPKWVIEGLATMFEAPGIRDSVRSSASKTRINRTRYLWFENFLKSRRQPHSLRDFIANDDRYASATLDAYAEGWALTFFLAETRHGSYGRYLKTLVARNPLYVYTDAERVADFKKSFGDLKSLENEYVRFYENLK